MQEALALIAELEHVPVRQEFREKLGTIAAGLRAFVENSFALSVGDEVISVKLTKTERRLFDALRSNRAMRHGVTKEQLMNAIYFDAPDCDWPESKIIDVLVCRLRKKLKSTGYDIETMWGAGVRLVKQETR